MGAQISDPLEILKMRDAAERLGWTKIGLDLDCFNLEAWETRNAEHGPAAVVKVERDPVEERGVHHGQQRQYDPVPV